MKINNFDSLVVDIATQLMMKPYIKDVTFEHDNNYYRAYSFTKVNKDCSYKLINQTTLEAITVSFKARWLF